MTAADAAAVDRQVDQFRHPDASGIEQMQHGIVAQDEWSGLFRQAQHLVYLGDGQSMGQAAAYFRRINICNRVGSQQVLAGEKIEKGAQGGKAPGIAA